MATNLETDSQAPQTEVRSMHGPVTGIKHFTTEPTQKDWESYKGNRTIGLADNTPGLIVPRSFDELTTLYSRQRDEGLTFFEFRRNASPQLDGSYHGELKINKVADETAPPPPSVQEHTTNVLKIIEMINAGTYKLPSSPTIAEDIE